MTDTPTVEPQKDMDTVEPQKADSLSIRDNRTGQEYEIAITDGTIHATDLMKIMVDG
jgi:citrate synthase